MNQMTLSAEALALMNRDPDFNSALAKDMATVGDVHVATSLGNDKKPKRKPLTFTEVIEEEPISTIKGFDEIISSAPLHIHAHLANAFTEIGKSGAPALKPHPDGGAHTPFPYDAQALDKIPPEQSRKFFAALTNPDDLPTRKVPIKSLVAMQPRVSPEKVADMQANGYSKLPTVVRNDGKNYIADGHHRAAASLLDGETSIDCKYCKLSGEDETLAKDWTMPVTMLNKSADADRQMIFGVASTAEADGKLIIDKQNDVIPTEELEDAVYDYVLEARDHGHMHKITGTGRLIESFVITDEKRAAYLKHGYTLSLKNQHGQEVSGWMVGYKIDDAAVWAEHKAGRLPEFSIGGESMSMEIP